ncbi:MAG: DUF305 domain-containing protein [Gaiellaceae bacterium]
MFNRAFMMLPLLVAVAFVVGCGGGDSDEPDSAAAPASSSAVPFDRSFIDAMVPHHESAIEMAEAAKPRLTQPDLIEVADDIIASQQEEIDRMLDWREEWFGSREVDPEGAAGLGLSEDEMGMDHGSMQDIENADDVDKAFAQAMIPHHQGAIEMAKLAQERGQHEEIKDLANDIVDAQEREIEILMKHSTGVHHGS